MQALRKLWKCESGDLQDGFVQRCGNGGGHRLRAENRLPYHWVRQLFACPNGANAGWMYSVNGEYPELALTEYELEDGESIGKPENYSYENLTVKSRIKAVFTGNMRFTDVRKKDWFNEDVAYVVENGLFHGTSKTTFSPNAPMTRGMLVTVFYRLADKPETTAASSFTDVAKEQYYAAPIAWAAENGIVSGMSQTHFAPNEQVTREQLAAILYRFAQKQGYGTARAAGLTGFADYSRISGYALDVLRWANAEKLVSGRSETELSPQGQATRAEVAAILHRFAENVAK